MSSQRLLGRVPSRAGVRRRGPLLELSGPSTCRLWAKPDMTRRCRPPVPFDFHRLHGLRHSQHRARRQSLPSFPQPALQHPLKQQRQGPNQDVSLDPELRSMPDRCWSITSSSRTPPPPNAASVPSCDPSADRSHGWSAEGLSPEFATAVGSEASFQTGRPPRRTWIMHRATGTPSVRRLHSFRA